MNQMNETYGNWGLDLTTLSENICKDFPISTSLINTIQTNHDERNPELELWQLIKKFVTLDSLKVKMFFLDYDENFRHLIYWGNEFLEMQGIDLTMQHI
jgi:hypothetical protein